MALTGLYTTPKFIGSIRYPRTASQNWSTSSSSLVIPAANASMGAPTVTGTGVSATATKLPALTLATVLPGTYRFIFKLSLDCSGGGASIMQIRGTDGTNVGPLAGSSGLSDTPTFATYVWEQKYTSALSNVQISLQIGQPQGLGLAIIYMDANAGQSSEFEISVEYLGANT